MILNDTLNNRKNVLHTARAFVPGHITGFFRIHDEASNPLMCGSRGAGFSVEIGTFTTVELIEKKSLEITTTYNNEVIDAQVTNTVVQRMIADYERQFSVRVNHESSLISGAGFGASGAGALGTALTLGRLIDPDMDYMKAAKYAHEAEVINHTGLGDVIAQTKGGLEIRVRPGGPGVGELVSVDYDTSLSVVLAGASGIRTRDVLTNHAQRLRINDIGDQLIEKMVEMRDFNTFISCSKKFTDSIGLATTRVTQVIHELENSNFTNSSMVMLGDSVFCFCEEDEISSVMKILCKYWDSSQVIKTSISQLGGRLVSW